MRGSLAVHTTLLEQDVAHEMFRLDRPSRSIEEAARAQGLTLAEVAKVTIFETTRGPIAVIAPGDLEPNADAVAAITGTATARRATPGASSRHTGFLADWIPPVGHRKQIPAAIDPRLLEHDVVYASGGEPGVILKMRSEDLQQVTHGVVALLAPSRLTLVDGLAGLSAADDDVISVASDGLADVT